MLCSETELGLAESADGILILPEGSAAPGERFVLAFPAAQDTIYELDVTPNRRMLSVTSAWRANSLRCSNWPFTSPAAGTPVRSASESLAALIEVDNRDTERCPHYAAAPS